MHLHEYQAKKILKRYDIEIPAYGVASNYQEVSMVLDSLGIDKAVVKIQVHAGGRGKAGGVKFANSRDEIMDVAKSLIGMKMVNNQTGPEGAIAHKVLIGPPCDIEKEYYCSVIIDREKKEPILIISPEGGMEIEEIAVKSPDRIMTIALQEGGVLDPKYKSAIGKIMDWSGELEDQGFELLSNLGKAFWEIDASMVEINPLILTPDKKIMALDAKISIDDNALYRQEELAEFYDPTQESAAEVAAKKHDLAYISLDGNIACMVNGAGLAMGTMDIIHYYGGAPANFLDVGGSATKEKVSEGFKIILSDPKVKAILVNIFGGIMNCATIAKGLIHATKELNIELPIVVRMEGTNVKEGRMILEKSGLALISINDFAEAAQRVVKESKG